MWKYVTFFFLHFPFPLLHLCIWVYIHILCTHIIHVQMHARANVYMFLLLFFKKSALKKTIICCYHYTFISMKYKMFIIFVSILYILPQSQKWYRLSSLLITLITSVETRWSSFYTMNSRMASKHKEHKERIFERLYW